MEQQGFEMPEFLSDHPSHEHRAEELKKFLPAALEIFEARKTILEKMKSVKHTIKMEKEELKKKVQEQQKAAVASSADVAAKSESKRFKVKEAGVEGLGQELDIPKRSPLFEVLNQNIVKTPLWFTSPKGQQHLTEQSHKSLSAVSVSA
jgi:hypothetical protein